MSPERIFTSQPASEAYALMQGYAEGSPKPQGLGRLDLSPKQWDQILAQIRRSDLANVTVAIARKDNRHDGMGLLQMVVEVMQPGGTTVPLLTRTHNISAGGLGFLHGRFIYPDSRCICWLRHAAHGLMQLSGTIRWCKLITGRAHMSGVEFDNEIEISPFLPCPED